MCPLHTHTNIMPPCQDLPGAHVSSREFVRFWVDYNRGAITVRVCSLAGCVCVCVLEDCERMCLPACLLFSLPFGFLRFFLACPCLHAHVCFRSCWCVCECVCDGVCVCGGGGGWISHDPSLAQDVKMAWHRPAAFGASISLYLSLPQVAVCLRWHDAS